LQECAAGYNYYYLKKIKRIIKKVHFLINLKKRLTRNYLV